MNINQMAVGLTAGRSDGLALVANRCINVIPRQKQMIKAVAIPGFSRGWGTNIQFRPIFPKNCMKLKEFEQKGVHISSCPTTAENRKHPWLQLVNKSNYA